MHAHMITKKKKLSLPSYRYDPYDPYKNIVLCPTAFLEYARSRVRGIWLLKPDDVFPCDLTRMRVNKISEKVIARIRICINTQI